MQSVLEKQAYRVDEFCRAFGIGRSKFYEEVGLGRLKVFKLGRLTLVSKESAHVWLERCQAESENTNLVAGGVR